jgi:flagellar biosynthesis/type III secretory pathway M-ring protein FliF/YscJ
MPDPSPLREKKPPTVSVTLSLKNLTELSREQAENVAKLVRFRFGVPPENLVISDQSGRTLYDPTQADSIGSDPEKLFAQSARFERDLADKVNRQLALAYGDHKALVTIASDWDHDQRTSLSETLSPKGVLVSEKNLKTETPQGSAPAGGAGGPAGTASNIAADTGFGVDNAATPGENARPVEASAAVATTSDVDKRYETGRSKVETVHTVPTLKRLSVSLLLDESLAAKKDEIAGLVKAAVGFDGDRSDVIQVGTTTFAVEPEPAPGDAKPAPEGGGTSPMLELVLRRGVEIVAAIAFLLVLFKSLKGARPARSGASSTGAALGETAEAGDAEPDPELLARARIEELVRTDPRRVGEILSRWASDDRAMARAGK